MSPTYFDNFTITIIYITSCARHTDFETTTSTRARRPFSRDPIADDACNAKIAFNRAVAAAADGRTSLAFNVMRVYGRTRSPTHTPQPRRFTVRLRIPDRVKQAYTIIYITLKYIV